MTRCDIGDRGLFEHRAHGVLDPHPQLLNTALMRLRAPFVVRLEAIHRRERPFERVYHFRDTDLARLASKSCTTVRAALRFDDARLVQRGELMFEEPQRYALRRCDRACRHRSVPVARCELDQSAKAV